MNIFFIVSIIILIILAIYLAIIITLCLVCLIDVKEYQPRILDRLEDIYNKNN